MTAWVSSADMQAYIGADLLTIDDAAALAQEATDAILALPVRDLTLQTGISDTVDTNNTDFVLLHFWPIWTIGTVSYNGQPISAAGFNQPGWRLDPIVKRKLQFVGMGKLPRSFANVTVTAMTAGYDVTLEPGAGQMALPGNIKRAVLLTGKAIWAAQAADPNLQSESTGGVFSGSFHAGGVGSVPPGARSLLNNEILANP